MKPRPSERALDNEVTTQVTPIKWEYFDRFVVFNETPEGMVTGLNDWINDAGADGWELVSSSPLIAPNKDGVAYGTIGIHLIFKREHVEGAAGGNGAQTPGV